MKKRTIVSIIAIILLAATIITGFAGIVASSGPAVYAPVEVTQTGFTGIATPVSTARLDLNKKSTRSISDDIDPGFSIKPNIPNTKEYNHRNGLVIPDRKVDDYRDGVIRYKSHKKATETKSDSFSNCIKDKKIMMI